MTVKHCFWKQLRKTGSGAIAKLLSISSYYFPQRVYFSAAESSSDLDSHWDSAPVIDTNICFLVLYCNVRASAPGYAGCSWHTSLFKILPDWRRGCCPLSSCGPSCCCCLNSRTITGKTMQVCSFSNLSPLGIAIFFESLVLAIFHLGKVRKQSGHSLPDSFMSNRLCQVDHFSQKCMFCQSTSFLCLMTFTACSGQLQLILPIHCPVILFSLLESEV